MDFIAIDFETANEQFTSACEIGLCVVRNYQVAETQSWLVRPPQNRFNPYNTMLHGLAADDVAEEPPFSDLWIQLLPYFEDQLVVAHNATFDMQVLRQLLIYYRIPFRPIPFTCSIKIAKKVWRDETRRYGLSSLSKHLGIELEHHRAASDATACAQIASLGFREYQVSFKEEIESKLNLMLGEISPQQWSDSRNKFQAVKKNYSRRYFRRNNF